MIVVLGNGDRVVFKCRFKRRHIHPIPFLRKLDGVNQAARIATLNALPELAAHYLAPVADPALRSLADPAEAGREPRERSVITFMDRVATQPRAVQAEEIDGLKAAGVTDADIVRLCELNAFMSYQCRVLAGLAALKGASA